LLIIKLAKELEIRNAKTPVQDFEQEKLRLCTGLRDFEEPPFTLQRICELLVGPAGEAYKITKAYAFAIEKVVYVTSTQRTLQPEEYNVTVAEYSRRMQEVKNSNNDPEKNSSRKRPKQSDMELGTPKKPLLVRSATPTTLVDDGENDNEKEKDHGSPSQRRGTTPTTTLAEGNDSTAPDMMDVDKD